MAVHHIGNTPGHVFEKTCFPPALEEALMRAPLKAKFMGVVVAAFGHVQACVEVRKDTFSY